MICYIRNLEKLEQIFATFSNLAWGTPLVILLTGGGLFFLLYSRGTPIRHIGHAINVLLGKYDKPDEIGQLNHYQALSTAMAATVGMGNISGVAIAISMGGPGAVFWMWMSAIVGISTKYFTCTLAVLYRGKDSKGEIQGGPMYVIREGLGRKWMPLAAFFSIAAMIGVSPIFQANQLTQIISDVMVKPVYPGFSDFNINLVIGIVLSILVSIVILGGVKRIGSVAGKLVPLMVLIYLFSVLYIVFSDTSAAINGLKLIVSDAFTGNALTGGAVGSIILIGVRRAAFSNEAGIGTAPMAHGAAKTNEAVREGLVAMLGPIIDTLIVCTLTALVIIVSGVWKISDLDGISMTAKAFEQSIPGVGKYLLVICVSIFSITTMFAFPYYGAKAFAFLFGADKKKIYNYFYIILIVVGSVSTLTAVINLIDGMFAMMAIPTMISALILSPKVIKETKSYFFRHKNGEFNSK